MHKTPKKSTKKTSHAERNAPRIPHQARFIYRRDDSGLYVTPSGTRLWGNADANLHARITERRTGFEYGVYLFRSHEAANDHARDADDIRAWSQARTDSQPDLCARLPLPANLKTLFQALDDEGVRCVLIGQYALYALGDFRHTSAVDLLIAGDIDNLLAVHRALTAALPRGEIRALNPITVGKVAVIRVVDEYVVDLHLEAGPDRLLHEDVEDFADIITVGSAWAYSLLPIGWERTRVKKKNRDNHDRA